MAAQRENRQHNSRPGWRDVRFSCAAIFALVLSQFAVAQQNMQRSAGPVVAPGNAVVTGFSGALPPIQIAPGVDPGTLTFIDKNGPSLRIVDLQQMGGPAIAQLVAAAKPSTFTAAEIGQVFGVVLDDNSPPDIYAAATSAYGLPIVAAGADGQPRQIKAGAPNATFMPGLWGPQGGPGSIWKIDGATGEATLFADVKVDGRTNSGAALGGLTYDPDSKSIFVADRESGMIYRLSPDGRIRDHYDHGVTGRTAQGLLPVPWDSSKRIDITSPQFDSSEPATWNYAAPQRRVFGLAVFEHRLYYAIADSLQIWSVGLNRDGSFGKDAVIEFAVPPSSGPTEISKITFDEQGRMFLAERPAPTGAFDLEAVAAPAIGRVLRYAIIRIAPDARRIWQEKPDEFAIGFPLDLRNGNGGVAIGYNYDANGRINRASCGGFMWVTGEDLRDASDTALAAQLRKSGPLHVAGLQGNGTWRIRRSTEPPLASYFIDYADEAEDDAARGHMGDIAVDRPCTPTPTQIQIFRPSPQAPVRPGAPAPPSGGGNPPGGGTPPGAGIPPGTGVPPSGGTPPSGGCARPNILVNGKCCSVASLAANAACSNSICQPGQTPIGPSNFCCNSGQVYTGPGGAQACCSGQAVNGQCPSLPPITINCAKGYVLVAGSCCLASQMTSTGMCCPAGQVPSGPNKSQCLPFIPPNLPPLACCPAGQIPSATRACCPTANVTANGVCCRSPVDPKDRSQCPVPIHQRLACAAGYTTMPDGSCCNNRFVSADRMSCNTGARPCPPGEFRELGGACVAILPNPCPPSEIRREGACVPLSREPCPRGEIRNSEGICVSERPRSCREGEVRRHGECVPIRRAECPSGQVRRHGECVPVRRAECPSGQVRRHGECVSRGPTPCPPGEVRNRRGVCVPAGPPPGLRSPRGFGLPILPGPRGGGGFPPRGGGHGFLR